MPDELLNRVDRKLFFARRGTRVWWNTIEGVALSLSDQQLITSLAIIIAGFREAFINDLDLYHWNTILYSGWLGITVHLVSLSMLQSRLNKDPISRNLRLGTMSVILLLLCIALFSTTPALRWWLSPATPARCLWNASRNFPGNDKLGPDTDSVLTYLLLTSGFFWRTARLIPRSNHWIRYWSRIYVERSLERRLARRPRQWPFIPTKESSGDRTLFRIYVTYVMFMDVAESTLMTILVLTFTLVWGATRLLLYTKQEDLKKIKANIVNFDQVRSDERELTFGQILALLLLLQPIFTAVGLIIGKARYCL